MPDSSAPWDGEPWAEADWYRHMGPTVPSGVHGTPAVSPTAGPLAWASVGLTITLATGRANVGGSGFNRTAPQTSVSVVANGHATNTRRDRLVLRRNLSTHATALTVLVGTPAATPVAPTITQDDSIYDLPLFSFLTPAAGATDLTGVVDERTWILSTGRPTYVGTTAPGFAPEGAIWFQV